MVLANRPSEAYTNTRCAAISAMNILLSLLTAIPAGDISFPAPGVSPRHPYSPLFGSKTSALPLPVTYSLPFSPISTAYGFCTASTLLLQTNFPAIPFPFSTSSVPPTAPIYLIFGSSGGRGHTRPLPSFVVRSCCPDARAAKSARTMMQRSREGDERDARCLSGHFIDTPPGVQIIHYFLWQYWHSSKADRALYR